MQLNKQQTFISVLWALADNIGVRALSFLSMMLLARWLGPEEFGLIGMITVFISLGQTLVVSGLTTSLIRTKEASTSDFNTVFYINVVLSVVIYAIIYIIAPFIALFYEQHILIQVIRVYSIVFLLTALSAVQTAILNKAMDFKKIASLSMPSTILGVIAGLYLGYNGYGVWSIVALYLTTEVTRTLLLWFFVDWKPALHFSREKFKIHFGFGYRLTLSSIIDVAFQNIYNIIIGKFFSVRTLGYFERSRRFCEYPSSSFTGIMIKVTFPLLARLQDEPERLAIVYKKILRFSFFIIAPVMLGSAALAKPIFLLVLGPEWKPAVLFYQILCLAMMFYPIHAFNLNILNVYGRSELFLKLEVAKKAISIIGIILALPFGVIGLVWSNVFTSVMALGVNMYYSGKKIHYSIREQLADIMVTFLIAATVAVLMYYLQDSLSYMGVFIQIALTIFIGGIIYLGLNLLDPKRTMQEALLLLKKEIYD